MIKVTFGEHDRCNASASPETRFVLRAISQQFSFTNFDNDIALLRLNDRVPITDFIRPVCLPLNNSKFIFYYKHLLLIPFNIYSGSLALLCVSHLLLTPI